MAVMLPTVMPSNNPQTAFALNKEFPGRLEVLLTPSSIKDPMGLPFTIDNGRYGSRNDNTKWSESAFWAMLEWFKSKITYPPLWIAVPDIFGDGEATLREWDLWSDKITNQGFDWKLALVVQDGMTPNKVFALDRQPDVIFIGGSKDWKWSTAIDWCSKFPHVHIGKVGTKKRLFDAQRAGAKSTDSNIWRPIGNHLNELRDYLRRSSEIQPPQKKPGLLKWL